MDYTPTVNGNCTNDNPSSRVEYIPHSIVNLHRGAQVPVLGLEFMFICIGLIHSTMILPRITLQERGQRDDLVLVNVRSLVNRKATQVVDPAASCMHED